MSLFYLLNPTKDYLLAGAVKLCFKQTQNRYGLMTQIRINSQNHRIDVELLLKGLLNAVGRTQPPFTSPTFLFTPIRLILSSSLLASERLPISFR